MITVSSSGSFRKTESFLDRIMKRNAARVLEKYGRSGCIALEAATPVRTGLAADSWYYKVEHSRTGASLTFYNSDVENGFPVAIMIQYGHGTGNGGYVSGIDYINPALKPIFDKILTEVWREVTTA